MVWTGLFIFSLWALSLFILWRIFRFTGHISDAEQIAEEKKRLEIEKLNELFKEE